MRRLGGIVLALGILAGAAPRAEAQPAKDPAIVATARSIALDALALFDKGDFAAALEKFNRADDLVHAPTMSLNAARCLEKLGRLVEAHERYRVAANATLDASASEALKSAAADAD